MAAKQLIDFSDIIEAVREELGVQSSDTVKMNRIRRDINLIYLDEVVPASRWKWLEGNTTIKVPAYYSGGTVAVTLGSGTITISDSPDASLGSFVGYNFSAEGDAEIYEITAHTAGSTTITTAPVYNGTTSATKSFKVWKDKFGLPVDCRETVEVGHAFLRQPMEGRGRQEFSKIRRRGPKIEGRPQWYYTGDFEGANEATRYRQIDFFPAISPSITNINIDYVREVSALELDGDEPVIPSEDRIILLYGALARMWMKERNPEAAAYNQSLYDRKLFRMLGRTEDTIDKPQFKPDSIYVSSKRGPRAGRHSASQLLISGSSGGGSNNVTYVAGITIAGGTVTSAITVSPGVTIDGRDISADGVILDAHLVDASDAHDASAISYINSSSGLTATEIQAAIDELDAATDAHLADTVDAHDATAISYSNATSSLVATDAQAAIDEVEARLDTAQSNITANASGLSDHLADTADAHDATAISYSNATSSLVATDAQAAIDEVEARLDTAQSNITANASGLSDHLADTVDAHDATAVSYSNATSGLAATNTQTAIDEVEARVDTSLQTSGVLQGAIATDAASTGSAQTLSTPTTAIVRLTNGSLASITGVTAPSVAQFFILSNAQASDMDVLNETGTSANQVVTGTGLGLTVKVGASIWLYYDLTSSKWRIVGGSGGGGVVATGTSAAPSEIAVSGITATVGTDEDLYVDTASGEINVTANPQISAGTVEGQTLRVIGTSDVNYVVLETGNGLSLNGPWFSYNGSVLTLRWDNTATLWVEVARSQ